MPATKQVYYHIICLISGNILKTNKRQFHLNGIKRAINQIIEKTLEYQQYNILF